MREIQITAANADEQIKQLYQTAFPEGEQIPWDDLMRLVGEMPLDFMAYYDGDIFIGFTIVYPCKAFNRRTKQGQSGTCSSFVLQGGGRPQVNWYWYFAVREELRGKGYGQQILTKLIERYKGQTCILDMESPTQVCENIDQRKRRHDFYLRNGFRDTYIYRTYNDITMTIMMRGEGTFTMKDWDDITNELKQFWWPEELK